MADAFRCKPKRVGRIKCINYRCGDLTAHVRIDKTSEAEVMGPAKSRLASAGGPMAIRDVCEQEIAHYRRNGWVKLDGFFPHAACESIRELAEVRMGPDPLTINRQRPSERSPNEYPWYARWDGCSHQDDWISQVSHCPSLAQAASMLMGHEVRFYFDHVFSKVPAERGGGATPWHQDLPHHPLDRQGALTMWIALTDCTPEMGTLRFLSGSHRAGLLGRYLNRRDGISLTDENPWVLEDYEMSPPLHLRAGDATIHNLAIVHCAPANMTPRPRWVYAVQWLPSSARYTGAPNHRTDGLGLEVDQPLNHPRFPIIPLQ